MTPTVCHIARPRQRQGQKGGENNVNSYLTVYKVKKETNKMPKTTKTLRMTAVLAQRHWRQPRCNQHRIRQKWCQLEQRVEERNKKKRGVPYGVQDDLQSNKLHISGNAATDQTANRRLRFADGSETQWKRIKVRHDRWTTWKNALKCVTTWLVVQEQKDSVRLCPTSKGGS